MKRIPIIDGKTQCSTCKKMKLVECFGADLKRWNGIKTQCKKCRSKARKAIYAKIKAYPEIKKLVDERDRIWQNENRDKVRGYCRRAYARNRRNHIARVTKWKNENKERVNDIQRRLRAKNPERYADYDKRSYENNRDEHLHHMRLRQARIRAAEGHCSVAEWLAIVKKQKDRCNACGKNDFPLTIDHIIPVVRGGSCWPSNIQGLCLRCNLKKGKKTMEEFLALPEYRRMVTYGK